MFKPKSSNNKNIFTKMKCIICNKLININENTHECNRNKDSTIIKLSSVSK